MFWVSVWCGFGMFAHWQTYVALLLLTIGPVIFLVVTGLPMLLAGESKLGAFAAVSGCLVGSILRFVFNAGLLSFVVFWLLPLMLGQPEAMSVNILMQISVFVLVIGLVAAVLAFVLSIIPVIGELINNLIGAKEFVQAVIIVNLLLKMMVAQNQLSGNALNAIPGFWATAGFFVIAALLGLVCVVIFSIVKECINKRLHPHDYADKQPSVLASVGYGAAVSMLPLFMYVSHISMTLKSN